MRMRIILTIVLLLGALGVPGPAHAISIEAWRARIESATSASGVVTVSKEFKAAILAEEGSMSPSTWGLVTDLVGLLVENAGNRGVGKGGLKSIASDVAAQAAACRRAVRNLEGSAGGDETALENLYRSQAWYEMSYALAAYRYWEAWVEFFQARVETNKTRKGGRLDLAERGFRAAALSVLYPSLVQGAWLGMAMVSIERGDEAEAGRRLRILQEALQGSTNEELKRAVAAQLGSLGSGKPAPLVRGGSALSAGEVSELKSEVLRLLKKHRKEKSGAIQAAEIIRKLLRNDEIDYAFIAALVPYRDEIVGQDIGPLGTLIDAEFAFAYEQYNTAIFKYEDFFRKDAKKLPIPTHIFRYHFAFALYREGLASRALTQIDRLKREKLPESLRAPVAHLELAVAYWLFQKAPEERYRKRLAKAAKRVLAIGGTKEQLNLARLALGQTASDLSEAERALGGVGSGSGGGGAAIFLVQRLAQELRKSVETTNTGAQRDYADRLSKAMSKLTSEELRQPRVQALKLQVEFVKGADPAGIIAKAAQLEADELFAGDVEAKSVLLWVKLRALRKQGGMAAVSGEVRSRVAGGLEQWELTEVLRLVLELERARQDADLVVLTSTLDGVLDKWPRERRQIQGMQVEALGRLGRHAEAVQLAQRMVELYPASGNAWLALARASTAAGDPFGAERAWAKIGRGVPEGSPQWQESAGARLALLDSMDRHGEACTLAKRLLVYKNTWSAETTEQYRIWAEKSRCATNLG